MTTRRRILQLGVAGALAPLGVFAQTRTVKIGLLSPRPLVESNYSPLVVQRLAELGYREGAGMILEARSSDGHADRFPKLARELAGLKCDLIFALGPEQTARALQDARSAAPIVFLAIDYDPLERGIVASLRSPDRNTTGVYVPQNALVAKRVEIMREVAPRARRFLVLVDPFSRDQLDSARKATEAAGAQLNVVEFQRPPYDYAAAFDAGRKEKVEALISLSSPVFAANEATIGALLLKDRLPGIGVTLRMAQPGYLLGLNVDRTKVSRRVAEVGARILKGTKPADIPVEQADEFELTINAKTARALGIKVPEAVLARATRIVQ